MVAVLQTFFSYVLIYEINHKIRLSSHITMQMKFTKFPIKLFADVSSSLTLEKA